MTAFMIKETRAEPIVAVIVTYVLKPVIQTGMIYGLMLR
jgi:hypothetical protein